MGKGKQLKWLDAHKENEKSGVLVKCINPTGTTTKEDLQVILRTMKAKHGNFQIYVEDNTSDYDLSLVTLLPGQKLSDITKKTLENAQITGNPIIVKMHDNQLFVYGNQYDFSKKTGQWDFVAVEAKDDDLNQLPFDTDTMILKRRENSFSPGLLTILKKTHTPYFQQWMDENSFTERDVKQIHVLQQEPLWNEFRDAYLAHRAANQAVVKTKLEADKKKVLAKHPGWVDTVEDHIIQTALYWAFLYISHQPQGRDTATYVWYDGKSTDTGNDALQFAQNYSKQQDCCWVMKNARHFPYDIDNLREFDKKTTKQGISMPAQTREDLEPVVQETILLDEKQFDDVLHPAAVGLLGATFLLAMEKGQSQHAVSLFFSINEELLKTRRNNSPPRDTDPNSYSAINRGLPPRQQEDKAHSLPASLSPRPSQPKRVSSSERVTVTGYATTFNARQKTCSGEDAASLLSPKPLQPLRALRVGSGNGT